MTGRAGSRRGIARVRRGRAVGVLSASLLALSLHAQTASAPAQGLSPEDTAALLATGLNAQPGGALRASATGRHVDIEQTVPVPADATPSRLKAGVDALHRVILDRVCHSASTRIAMRSGIDLTWQFRGQDGAPITQVLVDDATCVRQDAAQP